MKLIFDQNLSPKLSDRLQDIYPGSIHVIDVGLDEVPDTTIWPYARANGFVLVSKDSDYLRLSAAFGRPLKVIWIRTGNCPTGLVYSLLRDNYDEIEAFGQNPRRSVLELG